VRRLARRDRSHRSAHPLSHLRDPGGPGAVGRGGRLALAQAGGDARQARGGPGRRDGGPGGPAVEHRLLCDRPARPGAALDQQVAADASASAAVRAEAQAQELALARQQGQEAEIRAVLLAKGYPDALVYLTGQPASAVVVLEARTLTEDDAARAADAVERVAGVPEGDISVMAHR
jgi:stage III sporulation protein AH